MQDVQVSHDDRRVKKIKHIVNIGMTGPSIQLDDPEDSQMDVDFEFGHAPLPSSVNEIIQVKLPQKRYFVSVSRLSNSTPACLHSHRMNL